MPSTFKYALPQDNTINNTKLVYYKFRILELLMELKVSSNQSYQLEL
jgi:hypothetical protein